MIDAWRLAMGTLTALPTSAPSRIDRSIAGRAMLLAPVAGIVLALAVVLARLAVVAGMPPTVAAALTLAALALGTRGMHLDGLADTCDGLAASYDRERALAVMRTGDVGPAGAAAIAIVLLIDLAALAALLGSWRGTLLAAVAVVASRHTLAWLCRVGVPSARAEGLGATVAGSVTTAYAVLGAVVVAAAGGAAVVAAGGRWWSALVVVAAALVVTLALARRATSRLGGITGDVLGAGIELSLAVALASATVVVAA